MNIMVQKVLLDWGGSGGRGIFAPLHSQGHFASERKGCLSFSSSPFAGEAVHASEMLPMGVASSETSPAFVVKSAPAAHSLGEAEEALEAQSPPLPGSMWLRGKGECGGIGGWSPTLPPWENDWDLKCRGHWYRPETRSKHSKCAQILFRIRTFGLGSHLYFLLVQTNLMTVGCNFSLGCNFNKTHSWYYSTAPAKCL